mmetsp:Transcript_25467/g.40226  ORF Transcript_25467/g.40226 Transcript_25467/m.40226 type:complete len:97 (-) Transcript_25467:419-709(-)
MLRYTFELKDASKFLANCILSIFDRLGRSVHAVLKNFNDPTKADETPNLFVPLSLYVVIIRRILGDLAVGRYVLMIMKSSRSIRELTRKELCVEST